MWWHLFKSVRCNLGNLQLPGLDKDWGCVTGQNHLRVDLSLLWSGWPWVRTAALNPPVEEKENKPHKSQLSGFKQPTLLCGVGLTCLLPRKAKHVKVCVSLPYSVRTPPPNGMTNMSFHFLPWLSVLWQLLHNNCQRTQSILQYWATG